MLLGFGLRACHLGAESLSEDELNKLQTVRDYRENGLSGRNGEHPFLMKGLQTVSFIFADHWNASVSPERKISDEFALRFPTALFGTFTILLLFLFAKELFGSTIGLIAAALWAIEPTAIGFDRIAKEDSFLLFFFLLAGVFWVRSQTAANREQPNWFRYCLLMGVAFGATMASKYLPHILAIIAAYYAILLVVDSNKWRIGKVRWLMIFALMGVSFLIFNPTILLPDTWREMLKFSGEKRIGHDAYEYTGTLYRNQVTTWFKGVPWTFYYVFILIKTSLPTLVFFLIGLPLMFQRKLGDGRYYIFFWAFMWFMPFSVLGGKFTRYFTIAQPLIFIAAAVGFYFTMRFAADKLFPKFSSAKAIFQTVLFAALCVAPICDSYSVTPHFRLFTNTIGGGETSAGNYFPHDEFYDASTREIVSELASRAKQGAVVANETPGLFEYYAKKFGRDDLKFVSLTDPAEVKNLKTNDFIVAARGRRYFSNDRYLQYLESVAPTAETKAGEIVSAKIYQLDENLATQIRNLSMQ